MACRCPKQSYSVMRVVTSNMFDHNQPCHNTSVVFTLFKTMFMSLIPQGLLQGVPEWATCCWLNDGAALHADVPVATRKQTGLPYIWHCPQQHRA